MKNRLAPVLLGPVLLVAVDANVLGTCHDTQNPRVPAETDSWVCDSNYFHPLTKTLHWAIYWLDSNLPRSVDVTDYGEVMPGTSSCAGCWPDFDNPYWVDDGRTAYWYQKTYRSDWTYYQNQWVCHQSSVPTDDHAQGHTCPTPGECLGQEDYSSFPSTGCITGFLFGGPCTRSSAFRSRCLDPAGYEEESCSCPDGTSMSPIVIDVDHSGFSMTDAAGGVVFNMLNDGVPLQISWTSAGSTNAFLVLDRNGNGTIDNGQELFGDLTPQPPAKHQNGFLALAEYDKTQNGGNHDGVINKEDAIFASLRLWQDRNHNGVSEASELHTLKDLGLKSIDLDYEESRRVDQYGNRFRFRAKVKDTHDAQLGRWAWDVFLVVK